MLSVFLESLADAGRVELPRPQSKTEIDNPEARTVLERIEKIRRTALPAGLPHLDSDVALRGATRLYRAAQFFVYRDIETDAIQRELTPRAPAPGTASEHYSGDLCLRFMPDLVRMCRVASGTDPLTDQILLLLRDWPRSAAGTGSEVATNSTVWTHPGLRLMYLDRIALRKDREAAQQSHVQTEWNLWARIDQQP